MNRMWEIREHDGSKYSRKMGERMNSKDDKSLEEAYECGYEDGFEAAMEESKYGERSSNYRMGRRRY